MSAARRRATPSAAGDYPTYVPGIGHGRCVTFGRMASINAAGGNADEKIPDLDLFA